MFLFLQQLHHLGDSFFIPIISMMAIFKFALKLILHFIVFRGSL